ncbi:MAG: hypothetical protein J6P95_04645 [Paludibacteraceae bacterium]|nr:hypothetical protein [Paludibacteraceae bacterium]
MDKTKTAVILCIVIIVMLGAILYACRDKFLPSKEEKTADKQESVAEETTEA